MAYESGSDVSGRPLTESLDEDLEPRKKQVLAIYRKLHQAKQHKMKPIPLCRIPLNLIETLPGPD